MSLEDCMLVDLPKITDARGNLTFVEDGKLIPFKIKRVYYLYDIPENSSRAGHAHKNLSQLIIALSGSFEITLNDGFNSKKLTLNKPNEGLYLPPMIWRDITNFSLGAICLCLASDTYQESDYYRNLNDFYSSTSKHDSIS